jgi:hypothetical protein
MLIMEIALSSLRDIVCAFFGALPSILSLVRRGYGRTISLTKVAVLGPRFANGIPAPPGLSRALFLCHSL